MKNSLILTHITMFLAGIIFISVIWFLLFMNTSTIKPSTESLVVPELPIAEKVPNVNIEHAVSSSSAPSLFETTNKEGENVPKVNLLPKTTTPASLPAPWPVYMSGCPTSPEITRGSNAIRCKTYTTDGEYIYFQGMRISANVKTFEIFPVNVQELSTPIDASLLFARDKDTVFFQNTALKGITPASFNVLGVIGDKGLNFNVEAAFKTLRVMTAANPDVTALGKLYELKHFVDYKELHGIHLNICNDTEPRTWNLPVLGCTTYPETIPLQTMRLRCCSYKTDGDNIYFKNEKMDADAETFEVYPISMQNIAYPADPPHIFAKDRDFVYFQNIALRGVTPTTFNVLKGDGNFDVKAAYPTLLMLFEENPQVYELGDLIKLHHYKIYGEEVSEE